MLFSSRGSGDGADGSDDSGGGGDTTDSGADDVEAADGGGSAIGDGGLASAPNLRPAAQRPNKKKKGGVKVGGADA